MSDAHLASQTASRHKILVRGVNWLGDAVMSTPALERLREARPEAHISLLTPHKLAELWQQYPHVDAVLSFAGHETVWHLARRLRQERFDLALVLPNSPRSALEVFLARIPQRIGFARPWRSWLLTRPVAPPAEAVPTRKRSAAEIKRLLDNPEAAAPRAIPAAAHQLHHYLALAAALGASPAPLPPRISVTAEEVAATKSALLRDMPVGLAWFGLNPGAEYGPAKRWPAERFIRAAIELQRRTGCGWLVFGGPKDQALAAEIVTGLRRAANPYVVNLAGKTTLRELCAALRFCRVLLTNDTGPMHLAAAVGTPVVALFGSTSPELTGPGLPGGPAAPHALLRSVVGCAPCFRRRCPVDFRCMSGIGVEQAVTAVLAAVQSPAGVAPRRRMA